MWASCDVILSVALLPGIGFSGQAIAGGVLGLGMIFMLWQYLRNAQNTKARADSYEGWIRSQREAAEIEEEVNKDAKKDRDSVSSESDVLGGSNTI